MSANKVFLRVESQTRVDYGYIETEHPRHIKQFCQTQGIELREVEKFSTHSQTHHEYFSGRYVQTALLTSEMPLESLLDSLQDYRLLEQQFEELRPQYHSKLEREADNLAKMAAFLSGYLAARGGSGCGDCGHESAIKTAEERQDKVSVALGYFE